MSNTTTGSDRVVPGQQPPEERDSRLARLTRPAVTHWQFTIVLAAAIVVRIIVILGYPPILWFNDSYNYLYDAVSHIPNRVRPNGYPFFIDLLLPLHSAYPLAVLQAAMGPAWASSSTRCCVTVDCPGGGRRCPRCPSCSTRMNCISSTWSRPTRCSSSSAPLPW